MDHTDRSELFAVDEFEHAIGVLFRACKDHDTLELVTVVQQHFHDVDLRPEIGNMIHLLFDFSGGS